jgi:hypothetical protein
MPPTSSVRPRARQNNLGTNAAESAMRVIVTANSKNSSLSAPTECPPP